MYCTAVLLEETEGGSELHANKLRFGTHDTNLLTF